MEKRQYTIKNTDLVLKLANCAFNAYYPDGPPAPYKSQPEGFERIDKWYGSVSETQPEEFFGLVFKGNTSETKGSYIFSFKGTDSSNDWKVDEEIWFHDGFSPYKNPKSTDLSKVRVHHGFYEVYTKPYKSKPSMQQQLMALIQKYNPKKIFITGHSLGSALSTLFTYDLYISELVDANTITHYNFACPRVGDKAFANSYRAYDQKRSLRLVNRRDWVCYLPEISYWHAPDYFITSFYLIKGGYFKKQKAAEHSIWNYWQVLKKLFELTGQNPTKDIHLPATDVKGNSTKLCIEHCAPSAVCNIVLPTNQENAKHSSLI